MRPKPANEDQTDCPVCGAFKFSHQDVCRECDEHRTARTKQKQQAARNERYGSLWPCER